MIPEAARMFLAVGINATREGELTRSPESRICSSILTIC